MKQKRIRGVDVWFIDGTVLDANQWSETRVVTTTSTNTAGGQSSSVSSRTDNKKEIFIKTDDGDEESISLTNWDIALRPGSRTRVAYVDGDVVGISNLDTSKYVTWIPSFMGRYVEEKKVAFPKKSSRLPFLLLAIIAVAGAFLFNIAIQQRVPAVRGFAVPPSETMFSRAVITNKSEWTPDEVWEWRKDNEYASPCYRRDGEVFCVKQDSGHHGNCKERGADGTLWCTIDRFEEQPGFRSAPPYPNQEGQNIINGLYAAGAGFFLLQLIVGFFRRRSRFNKGMKAFVSQLRENMT